MIPNLILLAAAARKLNVPYDTLKNMLKRGEITPDYIGDNRYRLFKPESVQRIAKMVKGGK